MQRLDYRRDPEQSRHFEILPTINGWDVICALTGRQVDHRSTKQEANGVAYRLNSLPRRGPRALDRAFSSAAGTYRNKP